LIVSASDIRCLLDRLDIQRLSHVRAPLAPIVRFSVRGRCQL
jgi:hypothetical protein